MRRFIDIIWVAVLAAIVAVVLAELLGLLTRAVFDVSDGFDPLNESDIAVTAVIGAFVGVGAYWALTAWNRVKGVQVFFWLAVVAFILSLAGPLFIVPSDYPGTETGVIVMLSLMHLSVAAPATLLPIILGAGGAIRD